MKVISLRDAYDILEECSGVIVNDGVITYPSLSPIIDSDESEFLYLSWTDEGTDYYLKFIEGDNRKVMISDSSMFLVDTDCDSAYGETTQLTILQPKNIEK